MILVEKHNINKNHSFYNECDELCFKSKNLYNQALYNVRQHYFENKEYLPYHKNYHIAKLQESYTQLPTKVSCQTIRLVDQNFKSFFALLKLEGHIAKIPKYLDKLGKCITKFPKQSLSLKEFKKTGNVGLSQTNIIINTKILDFNVLKEVRIIPKANSYVIEVVYERKEKTCNNIIKASIDVGLNNLATICFDNKELKPFIINGRPLKSINQYYNKKNAEYQSKLNQTINKKEEKIQCGKSKRLTILINKRNNKISDYLHKASHLLVNQLVLNKVGVLIIGKNTGMKQDSNMGHVSNQNFVNVPIFRFLDMVSYKAKLEGITVVWQEESYTSKASFLNLDNIPIYGKKDLEQNYVFSGYRQSRGIYKIKNINKIINADVNGSYNILRKAFPNAFADGTEGFGVIPIVMNVML